MNDFSWRTVMNDADSNLKIQRYGAPCLTGRIKAAFTSITPESQVFTVAQLARPFEILSRFRAA
jgi:hypothetical protein